MACNSHGTVCMVLNHLWCSKLGTSDIQFVTSFRYLGHIISDSLYDNEDIQREIKNTFLRTNVLIGKCKRCSFYMKTALFRSYCSLWCLCSLWCSKLGTSDIQFVTSFRYLGYIISDSLYDNEDIQREIKNIFLRTNVLTGKCKRCSFYMKTVLFRSYCSLGLYDIALWQNYTMTWSLILGHATTNV